MEREGPSVDENEVKGKGTVEFEGPTVLTLDQNLFDQPPYNELFTAVIDHLPTAISPMGNPIDVDMARTAFSAVVKRRTTGKWVDKTPSELLELFMTSPQFDTLIQTSTLTPSVKLTIGRALRQQLPTYINDYPLVAEYADRNLAERRYKANGMPNLAVQGNSSLPTQGYGAWLLDRQKNDARLKEVAIEEVLGETFNQDPLDVINSDGKGVVNRRYRLVKATGI